MAFTIKRETDCRCSWSRSRTTSARQDEAVVNLTTATGAFFNMRAAGGGATKISRGSAAITTPASGVVTYSWGTADVNTAGEFEAEMAIVWSDGKEETFPNDSYWDVTITDDIA